jgi:tetratricopeptide (TPR) repeat protein
METADKVSLVLTDSSSFERLADPQRISYSGFYQRLASGLVKGIHTNQALGDLGESLVVLAEHAYAFRHMEALEQMSQILVNSRLPRQYEAVGQYYGALCVQRLGRGDIERALSLFERVAESATPKYRVRAMISLGANWRYQSDNQSALSFYGEAGRIASHARLRDPFAIIPTQKMVAVIASEDGNHLGALTLLENLFPLAHALRSSQPDVYYDYMNSLAVELCEVGRLEEAKNVSQIALASPFARAYPEWRETRNEIEWRGRRASRSIVAFDQAPARAASNGAAPEMEKLVHLSAPRPDSLTAFEPSSATKPARVLSMQEWKKKMPKQSNTHPQDKTTPRPTTDKEKQARLVELRKLDTRDLLLRVMKAIGDEDISDDQFLRALMIFEGIERDENQES